MKAINKIVKAMLTILICLALLSCVQTTSLPQVDKMNIQQQADTCDNPDAHISCSFVNIPVNLSRTMSIAPDNEPGEKLEISGTIYKSDGITPYPNVILYAYQTDHTGHYSKKGNETGAQKWHGYLHGWCMTDSNGQYRIKTIRPARYPDNSMPAHIHAAIKKQNGEMYWISDFVFKDDELVNQAYLATIVDLVGGTGIVNIKRDNANRWTGERDIVLK